MRTVLVASSKGGAGKSTLATNLAAYFALDGKRPVLVDADRQKSSTHWCEKRAARSANRRHPSRLGKNFFRRYPARRDRRARRHGRISNSS
jgi:cellulose biosynthesis protein BcsQ